MWTVSALVNLSQLLPALRLHRCTLHFTNAAYQPAFATTTGWDFGSGIGTGERLQIW